MSTNGTARSGPDWATLGAFAAAVLMGGTNVVAVRFSNRELAPFWGAGLRFALAAALLFLAVFAMRLALPRGRALAGAALYGVLSFGAFYAFAYWGLLYVPAGLASLLLAFIPLLTFLLAVLHRLEPFRWRGLLGSAIAIAGIGAMFAGPLSSGIPAAAVGAILVGCACTAEGFVLLKLFPGTHPVSTNAVGMAVGAAVLLVVSAVAGEAWRLPAEREVQVALAYLILVGSFWLYIAMVFVVNRWAASAAAYQTVLMPLVAVALSAWLEGEALTLGLLFGGALVLAGVYIGALSSRGSASSPAPPAAGADR